MIDVLVYLFENYHDFSSQPKTDDLARKLCVAGFERGEISLALDWLAGLKNSPTAELSCNARSKRVYAAREQRKLGLDCLSFIVFLESAGLVTPVLRELIVERGMMLADDPVSLSQFKIVVLMVLWSRQQDLDPLIVEELLCANEPERLH